MAHPEMVSARPDVDIEEDIRDLIAHYPPLSHDRHRVKVSARGGKLTVAGYVKSRATRHYLLEHLPDIDGVSSVNDKEFFDDETIRIEAGRIVPPGVQVNVEYGAVILSGRLPTDVKEADVVKKIKIIPGAHRVVTAFKK